MKEVTGTVVEDQTLVVQLKFSELPEMVNR